MFSNLNHMWHINKWTSLYWTVWIEANEINVYINCINKLELLYYRTVTIIIELNNYHHYDI